MELSKVVGHNVRFFRKQKGWSQKDLLREMPSYTQSRISLIERGGKAINLNTLEAFGKVLGVAPYELLVNRRTDLKRQSSELVKLLEELPKKERESLSRVIDAVLKSNGLIE